MNSNCLKTPLTVRVISATTSLMRLGFGPGILASFVCGILLGAPLSLASFQEDLQTQIFQYASQNQPTFYLNSKSIFQTERFLTRINAYYESGTQGTWSVDPDPLRYDLKLSDTGKNFIWIGRENPLNLTRPSPVEATDAVGTVWAQNQLNALNPRVSGWIGAGLHQELGSNWTLLLTYSPIFLPTFGPSLGFSDSGDLHPARFSRLPPVSVSTGGALLPIRYQLELGQITDLVLRPQFFTGIAHQEESVYMDAYFYTAPRPNALPLTTATLSVTPEVVNAKVQIDPQFPREYWTGMRTQFKSLPFQPAMELVQGLHQWTYHYASFTGYFDSPQMNPNVVSRTTRASFGILSHFQKQLEDPQFSDLLVFLKLPVDLTNELTLRNLIQATLLDAKQSFYWMSEFEYAFSKTFSALTALRILSGENYSYFGDWRSEDSFSIGMRWIW